MNEQSSKLKTLYRKYWDGLCLFRNKRGLSSPLLIKTKRQKIKLFVIGQETFGGWTGNSIKECQNDYREVLDLCLKTEKPKNKYRPWDIKKEWNTWRTYNSAFWRTVRKIISELKIDNDCVAWNNINRMDYDGHSPKTKTKKEMAVKFPLLPLEIKICKPWIIIFFTHQRYDKQLKITFRECKTEISFQKIQGLSQGKLARVNISEFNGKAYRTYHPAYKPSKEIEKIINIITKDF